MSPGYIEHFEQLSIYVLLYCSTGSLRGLWVQVDGEDSVTQIITLINAGFKHFVNSKPEPDNDIV